MKKRLSLLIGLAVLIFVGCGLLVGPWYLLDWLFWKDVIAPAPKRDIVYQLHTDMGIDSQTLELGFINANGTGKETQAILSHGVYARDISSFVAKAPFGIFPYFGFLTDSRPYVRGEGWLHLFRLPEWEEVPCKYDLGWRPYPVGTSGAWVGEYQWAEKGGILLFWPERPGCPKEDLWSRQELKALGVLRYWDPLDEVGFVRVIAFHRQNAVLLFGKGIHRWDLDTRQLEPWGTWIADCSSGELSYDDSYLACLHKDEEGVLLRVWDLKNRRLWRERLIRRPWLPRYRIEVSWSPDGSRLMYHRCVEPDLDQIPACELQGKTNVGIYIWDLEQDKERLLTRPGVMPFWVEWEK